MEYKKIKDLDIFISDGNYSSKYPSSKDFLSSGVPFIRCNNFDNNSITARDMYYISQEKHDELKKGHLKTGDVLISTRGNIGQTVLVPKKYDNANINAQIVLLRPIKGINNEYLMWVLKTGLVQRQIQQSQTGSALKQLPVKKLLEITIPFVSDEKQQKKISHKLNTIFNMINIKRNQIEKLDELIKSQFVEMFGTPLVNEKKYNVENAEKICLKITDGSHYSPIDQGTGYPMLSVKDMRNDGFHYDSCKYISIEDYSKMQKLDCIPKKNDVLIAKDGSYFYYGFVIEEEKNEAILSSIAMLRPDIKIVNPFYLRYYMMSPEIVDLVSKNYVTGAALKRVILKGIKQIPVMIPNIDDQNKFEIIVKQIDKQKFEFERQLEKLEELQASLMQEYFG